MLEGMNPNSSQTERSGGVETTLEEATGTENHIQEEAGNSVGPKGDTPAQKSESALQEAASGRVIRRTFSQFENIRLEDDEKEISHDSQGRLRSVDLPSAKSSANEEKDEIRSPLETLEEEKEAETAQSREKILSGKAALDGGEDASMGTNHTTLMGSRITGLGISMPGSSIRLHHQVLEALETDKLGQAFNRSAEKQKRPSYEEWSDQVWLNIAARQKASRRSRKRADIALRKEKYPELYRDDVSIYPSYTDLKLPYFAVARQRYLRALRRIQEQIQSDIEEMALLQPRALDGVRVMRTFCQGAAPTQQKHSLSEKEQRRLDYLLVGNIV